MSSSCVRRGFLQPQEIQVPRLRVAVASHDSHVNGETRKPLPARCSGLQHDASFGSEIQNMYLRKSRTVLRVKEPQKEALKKCSATKWPNRATHIHCICILYFVGQVNSRDEQSTEAVAVHPRKSGGPSPTFLSRVLSLAPSCPVDVPQFTCHFLS